MKKDRTYFPPYTFRFWKAYSIHMRPYLLFLSGICGLAGMAIANQEDMDSVTFLMTFIPLFLAYGLGQPLTDCFQVDTDTISSPYRPLTRGEISPVAVAVISLIGLTILVTSLILMNAYNAIWGFLSVIGLATYTYFKRNVWFAGPFYNGWIVMLLPVMGYMAVTGVSPEGLNNRTIILLAFLSLFSYANFVLIGYLKDIHADRSTNYKTFPVVFGWDKTMFAGDLFVLLSMIFCFMLIGNHDPVSLVFFIAASVIAISGQLYGHLSRNKTEDNAAFPISSTVRSLILWHSAVVVHYRPGWLIFTVVFYLCFEIVLYFRPEKNQI